MFLKKLFYYSAGLILCVTLLLTIFCSSADDATGPEDETPLAPGEIKGAVDADLQDALDFNQLSLLVPNNEMNIGYDGAFDTNFIVGNPDSLQTAILAVMQDDQPVLLTYACSNSSLNPLGTTMEVGAQSTSLALVMMHPLFYGSTPEGRVEISNRVTAHPSFSSLVTQVNTAIQNDPTTYLDSLSTYDALYQQAGEIALSVYDAIVPVVQKPSETISKPESRPKPYADANNSNSIKYFNPFYIYYGTGVYDYDTGDNIQTFLQSPRNLYWGVVPFVGDYGETVYSLSEGDYTFKIYKGFNFSSVGTYNTFDPTHPSGRGTWANTLTAILNIIGLICPYSEGTDVAGLLTSVNNFSNVTELGNAVRSQDVTQIITAFIFFINDNMDVIVDKLWSPQDASDVGKYLSKLSGALSNVALPLKVLQAETKVPFFFDLAVDGPSEEVFSRRFQNSMLTNIELGPIQVTQPDAETEWELGEQDVTITWNTGNVPGNVTIDLYKGSSLIDIISNDTPNDGLFDTWDVPSTLDIGDDYSVKVSSLSAGNNSDSSNPFTIRVPMSNIEITEPNSASIWIQGQQNVTITWDPDNVTGNVAVALYKGDVLVETLASATSNDGNWVGYDVPADMTPGTDYRIKVTPLSYPLYYGVSDDFEIKENIFEVTEPNSSTVWQQGQQNVTIRWGTGDVTSTVDLALYKGSIKMEDIVTNTPNDALYGSWDIPWDLTPANDYRVKITSTANSSNFDFSDYFEIESISSDPFEPNNSQNDAYAVTLSGTPASWQSGSGPEINPLYDQDWFSFSASSGDEITVECDATSSLEAEIVLYYNGSQVEDTNTPPASLDPVLTYTVPSGEGGTYYVGIGYYSNIEKSATPSAETGSYELTITKAASSSDPYEPNDTSTSAYAISLSGSPPTWSSGSGPEIDPSTDQDWFSFTASSGDEITVEIDATSSLEAEIVLYYNGSQVEDTDGIYSTLTYTVPSGEGGTYYVGIGYYGNIEKSAIPSTETGSYELTITKTASSSDPYEPNDTSTSAYAISFSGSPPTWSSGSGPEIDPSTDQDWFSFTASSGDEITVECDATSSLEAEIVLYYNGSQVEDTNVPPSSLDPVLTYTVPSGEGGTYYVGIGYYGNIEKSAIPSTETGSYELTITKVTPSSSDPYEPNDTRTSAYAISFSGSPPTWASGTGPEIDPGGDQDWFRFSASAGQNITVECDVTSDLDPEIVLYYGSSKVANKDAEGSGDDETLSYTVPSGSSGTYYVGIAWYPNLKPSTPTANTGTYRLTITKGAPATIDVNITSPANGSTHTTNVIEISGTVSDNSVTEATLIVNGNPQTISVSYGTFSNDVVITSGTNTIRVEVTSSSGGFGYDQITVTGNIPTVDIKVTLTWNTNETDLDLYVTDPNGETVWYPSDYRTSSIGGELDTDDTDGYGPENFTLTSGEAISGSYIVEVKHYSKYLPSTATVTILKHEGQYNESINTYTHQFTTSKESWQVVTFSWP